MSAVRSPGIDEYAPMRAADLIEVAAVEQDIYPFPWTHGNFADALQAGYSAWLLRDARNADVRAYAIVMFALDEAHLLNLTVARSYQRMGIGWRTLSWMADTARDYGARSLLLEVRPSNAPALRMYQRYGFERIGVRRAYYPALDGREDAVVMRIAL